LPGFEVTHKDVENWALQRAPLRCMRVNDDGQTAMYNYE